MTYEPSLRAKLLDVADRLPTLRWQNVWPAFHGACQPHDDDYVHRVGQVFAVLRAETDTRSQDYLSAVLRACWRNGTLADVIRGAAERLREEAS